ncbi:glycerol ethanol, ferric requiring protein [Physocladia obscura]|uniref:Chloride channel protein n=1 Tax=Physocladia obscura TaxID=109957 RepID=A0AAD5T0F8_9FUNG|nr:glycerol ethanol, ferric requiring protein [Physocladia obscura]
MTEESVLERLKEQFRAATRTTRTPRTRNSIRTVPGMNPVRGYSNNSATSNSDSSNNNNNNSDWTAFSDRRVAYDDFATIDWLHDEASDRARQISLKNTRGWRGWAARFADGMQAWIGVWLVGVATGLSAGLIDISSIWLNDVKEGHCKAGFYLSKKFCCWHRPVKFYAPYAAGEGIPEIKTILGGFVIKQFLSVRTLLIKILGITLSVGSGLSLGKEGPLVHIACCFGNIISRIFSKYRDNEAKKRHLLSAASAAGISVAFGAPVGGVLFALEEVSYYFPYKTMWRSFFCAMIGAIVLRLMNPFRTGKLVWFEVKLSRRWHSFELPAFILLGILGGLFGTLFIRLNTQIATYRKKYWSEKPIIEVFVVALITGLVGFAHVYLRVSTVDLVANLFRECADIGGDFHGMCANSVQGQVIFLLLFAACIKFFLTVFTFGTKVPAGVFTPSIAVGALVGRAMGIVMSSIQAAYPTDPFFTSCSIKPINNPCITPATYAIIGAAAFLSGTTRMTMSLTVIMFELTGALSYVLPIMVTVLTAKWVGDYLSPGGLYAELITLGGYPYLDSSDEYIGAGTVGDIMTGVEALRVIPGGSEISVAEMETMLSETRFKGFPVVLRRNDWKVVGFAGRSELRFALSETPNTPASLLNFISGDSSSAFSPAIPDLNETPPTSPQSGNGTIDMRQWINPTPTNFPTDFPISLCVEYFKKMGIRYILVTERETGVLAGIVTKKDLLKHVMYVKDGGVGVGFDEDESQQHRRRLPVVVTNRSGLI